LSFIIIIIILHTTGDLYTLLQQLDYTQLFLFFSAKK